MKLSCHLRFGHVIIRIPPANAGFSVALKVILMHMQTTIHWKTLYSNSHKRSNLRYGKYKSRDPHLTGFHGSGLRSAYQGAEQYGLHYFIMLPEEGIRISFQTNVVCKNWGGGQCPKYLLKILFYIAIRNQISPNILFYSVQNMWLLAYG